MKFDFEEENLICTPTSFFEALYLHWSCSSYSHKSAFNLMPLRIPRSVILGRRIIVKGNKSKCYIFYLDQSKRLANIRTEEKIPINISDYSKDYLPEHCIMYPFYFWYKYSSLPLLTLIAGISIAVLPVRHAGYTIIFSWIIIPTINVFLRRKKTELAVDHSLLISESIIYTLAGFWFLFLFYVRVISH